MHDLVVRDGFLVDGTGRPGRYADVAVTSRLVMAVGRDLGRAARVLDAHGLVVTPGFVDPHTHFDGQATWDPLLEPSSLHGVTSAVMGNCGVGFAPVAADRHDWLVAMMEGVEDIPGTALSEGIEWGWESFPEYLDCLESRARTIDVGAQVPHAPLRAFVMGDRGADPDAHPTGAELDEMSVLVDQAMEAGALGVSTSRSVLHKTSSGDYLGTLRAATEELLALVSVLGQRREGVVQLLSDVYRSEDDHLVSSELDLITRLARVGRPVSFTVQQARNVPDRWRRLLDHAVMLAGAGLDVAAQVAPRPIGVLLGLEATTNPFSPCRPYQEIAPLPLRERVAAMREPERRRRIVASHVALTSGPDAFSGLEYLGAYGEMFVLSSPVSYDLDRSVSVSALASAAGAAPAEYLYDLMLAREGRQLVYRPVFNFAAGDLGAVRDMITSPVAMFGLSDAGAHCGTICDASMTTTYLTMWGRDRVLEAGPTLEEAVRQITSRPAQRVGWLDRGIVAPGYLGDLNVVDLEELGCLAPEIATDLPAGGRRLVQRSVGYEATVKRGIVTYARGEHTGALPGRLVRGARPAPSSQP